MITLNCVLYIVELKFNNQDKKKKNLQLDSFAELKIQMHQNY